MKLLWDKTTILNFKYRKQIKDALIKHLKGRDISEIAGRPIEIEYALDRYGVTHERGRFSFTPVGNGRVSVSVEYGG